MEGFGLGSDFAVLEGALIVFAVLPQEGSSMSVESVVGIDVFLTDAGIGGKISFRVREGCVAFYTIMLISERCMKRS